MGRGRPVAGMIVVFVALVSTSVLEEMGAMGGTCMNTSINNLCTSIQSTFIVNASPTSCSCSMLVSLRFRDGWAVVVSTAFNVEGRKVL